MIRAFWRRLYRLALQHSYCTGICPPTALAAPDAAHDLAFDPAVVGVCSPSLFLRGPLFDLTCAHQPRLFDHLLVVLLEPEVFVTDKEALTEGYWWLLAPDQPSNSVFQSS